MDCCASISRALLIFFNFVFWICGAAILGVGIWFLVDKDISSKIEILKIDSGDDYFNYAAYLFIGFGAFVFIVGFAGMCGAIRASKCLLGFYIFFVFLVICAEIAAAVLVILYRTEVEDKVGKLLQDNIKEKYASEETVRSAWDFVQIEFKCCGAESYMDYDNITVTGWEVGQPVPLTCCKLTNPEEAMKNPQSATAQDKTQCFGKNADYLNVGGCKESLKDWALKYSAIIIGVGIGIAVLEVFSIIWACCFCRNIGKDD